MRKPYRAQRPVDSYAYTPTKADGRARAIQIATMNPAATPEMVVTSCGLKLSEAQAVFDQVRRDREAFGRLAEGGQ